MRVQEIGCQDTSEVGVLMKEEGVVSSFGKLSICVQPCKQGKKSLCDLCVIWIVQGRFSRKMHSGLSNTLVHKVYSSGICTGFIHSLTINFDRSVS